MTQPNYLKGVSFCLIATLSWGAMFPVMTHALERLDPFNFTAARYTLAGLAFALLLYFREGASGFRLKGERVGLAWLFGTAGFAGFGFLVFLGQQLAGESGALTASIMMATMPILGLLVTWLLRGTRPPLYAFFFIGLSFCGVALVITQGDLLGVLSAPQNYAANIPLIAGALCWVLYTVGASYFPHWSPYKYTAITTALGLTSIYAIDAVLIGLGTIPLPTVQTLASVAPHLVYMALVAGFIGVLSWNLGNKIISPLNGVLFMDVVPVTAFMISALTGVVATQAQIVGAGFTATALILNNLFQRRLLARSASAPVAAKLSPARAN